MLEQAEWGYLDRRGHVRLWLDRVRVDTRIDPVVHPVIAALDLTRSGARGQEILEDFEPPEGFHRVW